ncbi:MAG: DUF4397 domain-containing protein [Myxococcota bacterium]|nr:DUF4397 domain-containing protein [Myxococcota bacterium]
MWDRGRAAALALAMLVALVGCETPVTRLRVVHVAGTTPALDVWTGGQRRARGLVFGDSTEWLVVTPGELLDLRVSEHTSITTRPIGSGGDLIAVVQDGAFTGGGEPAVSLASVPRAQGRGLELVLVPVDLVPLGAAILLRLSVPDRPGLIVEAAAGRAASLVLPADVSAFTVQIPGAPATAHTFAIDDAMRAAGRVLLVPVFDALRTLTVSEVIAIDPGAPYETATWIVPSVPRVHLLHAITGTGVTLRFAGDDPVASCLPPMCALARQEIVAGSALVELVASGTGRALDTLEVRDLVAGEERLVIALGDSDGDPAPRLLELPIRARPLTLPPSITVVHAAARLGPIGLSTLSPPSVYQRVADDVALGGIVERIDAVGPGIGIGIGAAGGPVAGLLSSMGGPESTIVVLTSADDTFASVVAITMIPTQGFSTFPAALEPP